MVPTQQMSKTVRMVIRKEDRYPAVDSRSFLDFLARIKYDINE